MKAALQRDDDADDTLGDLDGGAEGKDQHALKRERTQTDRGIVKVSKALTPKA